MMPTYRGGAFSEEVRYEKYDFDQMQESSLKERTLVVGLPFSTTSCLLGYHASNDNDLYSNVVNNSAIIGVKQPAVLAAAGSEQTFGATLHVGPKDQEALLSCHQAELVVDYGWLCRAAAAQLADVPARSGEQRGVPSSR